MFSGSIPKSIAIVVGITFTNLVIKRLIHWFVFFPSNPSNIDWPAIVPVIEEEIPDDNNVTTKMTPAPIPNKGISVL